jgi:hypothetical protein
MTNKMATVISNPSGILSVNSARDLSELNHDSEPRVPLSVSLIYLRILRQGKVMTFNIINRIYGLLVFSAGVVNTFWGNDPEFGGFILLLSFVYFPPTSAILDAIFKKATGFSIPKIGKIVLGIFILWATLGVGELFDKIDLMIMDFIILNPFI